MMLRAVYAVCNVLLSLTSFPLPTHLAGLHLEVSSVPCAAASFVTWTLKGFLKCGKQIAEDTAGNWQGKGKWTFWKEGELWALKIWFIPSVCNRLARQSQEWCLKLIPTKCYYIKWLNHRQHNSSGGFTAQTGSILAKLQTELMQQQSRLFFLVRMDRRATAHAKAIQWCSREQNQCSSQPRPGSNGRVHVEAERFIESLLPRLRCRNGS